MATVITVDSESVYLPVRMSPQLRELLKAEAAEQRMSMSEVLTWLAAEYFGKPELAVPPRKTTTHKGGRPAR